METILRESASGETKLARKGLVAVLLLFLILGLSACGGGGTQQTRSQGGAPDGSSTPTESTDPVAGQPGAQQNAAPTVLITAPTEGSLYLTANQTLSLAGTAGDDVGVVAVNWSNNRGGEGSASGTTAWTASGVPLQVGTNIITVTALDQESATGTATLTVEYQPPGGTPAADTTAPSVQITGPTRNATYLTINQSVTLAGTAADNIGVARVSWSNSRGGSGTASGTGSWQAASVPLQAGSNIVTVTAIDAANNTAIDRLTITYDGTAPTVTGISPARNATNVATDAVITATFSEPMNASTFTAGTFGVSGVTGAVSYSGTTATFRPSAPLAAGTGYTVTIAGGAGGVKDLAGNPLATNVTWSFSTAPAPTTSAYRLSWDPVPDARVTGYRAYYSSAPLNTGRVLGTIEISTASVDFVPAEHGLRSGDTLYMAVSALGGDGHESPLSSEVSLLIE